MDVTLVTSNPGKVAEVRRVFSEHGIQVHWDRRDLPEPQADRLEDVVRAKLRAAARPGRGIVVEDSGLFVDSLAGFPGVYSRYVLDTIGLPGILRLVRGRPRAARFRAVAGYCRGRTEIFTSGEVRGRLAPEARGSHGFGYDPIFIPAGGRRTFGEVGGAVKDRASHRGQAIRALARRIHRLESG